MLRLTLPDADPCLLPLVGAARPRREIEIYRIDPELARDQGLWIAVGVGAVRRRLLRRAATCRALER